MIRALALAASVAAPALADDIRATGDLGVVVERASGALTIIDQSDRAAIGRVEGLGDLSHASVVFSPDERFAYVFGRDGGLSKVDILTQTIAGRVIQAGNSIGGAISDDGELVAVSNYEPGGVRVFDAETLEPVADIPTGSKTIGLVDAPGRRFVFTLWDAGEAWIADFSGGAEPEITKVGGIGANPYDALITSDGRTYIAGLFGEDGLSAIDLWDETPVARRILAGYGKDDPRLPVYKMPHLEGWALAGERFVLPAVGRHEVLWIDARSLDEVGRIGGVWPAGVRGGAAGRAASLGQFRTPRQRHGAGDRHGVWRGRARSSSPAPRCCTWNSRRAGTRSGSRCATRTGSTSTTRRPSRSAARSRRRLHRAYSSRRAPTGWDSERWARRTTSSTGR